MQKCGKQVIFLQKSILNGSPSNVQLFQVQLRPCPSPAALNSLLTSNECDDICSYCYQLAQVNLIHSAPFLLLALKRVSFVCQFAAMIAVLLGALACVALRRITTRQRLLPARATHQMLNGQLVCTPAQRSLSQHSVQPFSAAAQSMGLAANGLTTSGINSVHSTDPNQMTHDATAAARVAKTDPLFNSLLYNSQSNCAKQMLYEDAQTAVGCAGNRCFSNYAGSSVNNDQQQQFATFYCPSPYASTRLSYFFQDNPLSRINITGAGGQLATYTKSAKRSAQENSYDMPLLKVTKV